MRRKIIAGNWKMNKNLTDGKSLVSEVTQLVKDEVHNDALVVMCTPFISLDSAAKLVGSSDKVFIGAQNCSNHASGAYTGETSLEMIESTGAKYVIVGHSERRQYFQEDDALLAEKTDAVLAAGLVPIFCCGESLDVREAGTQNDFVTTQLTSSLFHLSADALKKVVVAYEPIWAIGTGKTANSQQAQDMHAAIRAHFASKYGQEVADEIPILYGGSLKPSNADELFACPDVDGGLIGGASLKARDFVDVIKAR